MIKFNKLAIRCYDIALRQKKLTIHSSYKGAKLGISSEWRRLVNATDQPSKHLPSYTEQEEKAVDVIIASMNFLQHIGCKDIEQLIRDKIEYNDCRD